MNGRRRGPAFARGARRAGNYHSSYHHADHHHHPSDHDVPVPAGAHPLRGSHYEYQPPQQMGACTQHKEEKKGWEEHLARMEQAQDQLIQVTDDALMRIPGTVVQMVQAELRLQRQQQQQVPVQKNPSTPGTGPASTSPGSGPSSCEASSST
ncbi:UNVERIFIED_CONTAM: hypothetical protein K2H54_038823 [Gekko kuhli]